MKNLSIFFLLLSVFTLTSCDEKVSEGIANANSGGDSSSDSVGDGTQAMRVVNKKDSLLSYVMHKAGTIDEACELAAPTGGFDAKDYTKADTTRNVDCILDAEELDIFFHGAEYEIQADNKMCEYIEYQPYRYFYLQPGSTNRIIYKTTCDSACATASPEICDRYYEATTGAGPYGAGSFTTDVTRSHAENKLCIFNHTGDANCDEGYLNIEGYKISGYLFNGCSDGLQVNEEDCTNVGEVWHDNSILCNAPGDPVGTLTVSRDSDVDAEEACGGDAKACLAGAGLEQLDGTDFNVIEDSSDANFSKTYSIEAPIIKEYSSNRHVANFSRICSDTTTNKNTPSVFDTLTFSGVENEKIAYTYSHTDVDVNADAVMDGATYADHPFSGSVYGDSLNGARRSTSPYYSIRCLDGARDVKAQIRLYIREWDREFEASDIYTSKISDLANEGAGFSNMDNDGFYDTDIPWNDYSDWDDFLKGAINPIFVDNMCSTLTDVPGADPNYGKGNFPGSH